MKDFNKELPIDSVYLADIFAILWAHKIFITLACTVGVSLGVYKIVNTNQEFTASATFQLSGVRNKIPLSRELNLLQGLTGIGNLNDNKLPVDEVMGREFIKILNSKVDFLGDPYFNTFKPNNEKNTWKAKVKKIIGWPNSTFNAKEGIWQSISSKYNEKISLYQTPKGATVVKVTHEDPNRSAQIANAIMSTILDNSRTKELKIQDQQLNYLSKTLADALDQLETSQSLLKNFTIENSALPLEEFTAGSLKLNTLREKLNQTSKLRDALGELTLMLEKNLTTRKDYLTLSKSYPIIDQVDFRRVLGQNEIISDWNWPKLPLVKKVFATLTERKERLEIEYEMAQLDTKTASQDLEEFSRLKRDAKIAEATHAILIEQVKSQTMAAGYRPDTSKIYEYAAQPLNPSAPKRSLILIIYTLLGLFIGCIIPIIYAVLRGNYYSQHSLFKDAKAQLNINVRPLLSLRRRDLVEITSLIANRHLTALRCLATEVHKHSSNQIIITSASSRLKSIDLARGLATYMQTDQYNIGIINFSEQTEKLKSFDTVGSFFIKSKVGNVSHLQPKNIENTVDFLGKRNLHEQLEIVQSKFDIVFLCADNIDAISLARAIYGSDTFHLVITRLKHTQSQHLTQLRKLLTIQGLLYE